MKKEKTKERQLVSTTLREAFVTALDKSPVSDLSSMVWRSSLSNAGKIVIEQKRMTVNADSLPQCQDRGGIKQLMTFRGDEERAAARKASWGV